MGVSGLEAPRHVIAHRKAVTPASIRHAGIPISTRHTQYDTPCGIAASLKSDAGWWQAAVSPFPMKIMLPGRASNQEREVLQSSSETSECVILLGCRQSGDLGTGNPLSIFGQLFVAPDKPSDAP